MKKDWSRPYAEQPEILEYLESVRHSVSVSSRICASAPACARPTGTTSARCGGSSPTDGEELVADVVVSGMGMFNELNRPADPRPRRLPGHSFHSARWDHDHDLTGEAVAVIGSAASAVQFVPEIAQQAGRLHVFQRSPQWVLPKDDTPFTEEELHAFRTDPMAARLRRWEIWRTSRGSSPSPTPTRCAAAEEAGLHEPGQRGRSRGPGQAHAGDAVRVPAPADLQRLLPHVQPADDRTRHRGRSARSRGNTIVTVDGRQRPVDTIITATGFATTQYASAIEVTGRGGQPLAESWADGAQAYLGITTAGFPNLFMLYGPNTNNGSIIFMLECQVAYIMRQLDRMDDEGLAWIDLRADVMERYNDALQPTSTRSACGRAGATATTAARPVASSRSGRTRCSSTAPGRCAPTPTPTRCSGAPPSLPAPCSEHLALSTLL